MKTIKTAKPDGPKWKLKRDEVGRGARRSQFTLLLLLALIGSWRASATLLLDLPRSPPYRVWGGSLSPIAYCPDPMPCRDGL